MPPPPNVSPLPTQVLLPLLQTLAYLHNEGIIHRDIKPEHVLFNSEKVAKLSGFFLSVDVTRFGFPSDMVRGGRRGAASQALVC